MLSSFLQLLQIEQKSCVLKIKSQNRKGVLYFSKGELIEAVYGKENGEKAAQEIVCWEDAEIEIVNVGKKIQKRINKSLQNLLLDAVKEKDEADFLAEIITSEIDTFPSETTIDNEPFAAEKAVIKTRTTSEEKISENNLTKKPTKELEINMANNIEQALNNLMEIAGAMAVALVDLESGMAGGGVNLEVAAAGNTEVVKSKQKVMSSLGLKDKIEDILISLGSQYHLIRPLKHNPSLFLYLVLGREKSNLAMARFKLNDIDGAIQL